ncbi:MAG: zinc-ribbon domain-containing protein [Deltaproteobacteria bacterium]|nr:zinc-ribbon domain-containing protein [Deltaproteobacteria bacterium]
MIVACDKCQSQFSLDEERVRDKIVKIRCSDCQHIFQVGPGPVGAVAAQASADEGGDGDLALPQLPELEGLQEALAAGRSEEAAAGPSQAATDRDLGGKERGAPSREKSPALHAAGGDAMGALDDLGVLEDLKGEQEPLDATQDLGELGELEDLDVEQPSAAQPDVGELGGLDDLGDLEPLDQEQPAVAAAAPEPAAGGGDDLDDLGLPDFSADDVEAAEEEEEQKKEEAAMAAAATEGGAEPLDLGLGDSPEQAAAKPEPAEDDDLGLPELEEKDISDTQDASLPDFDAEDLDDAAESEAMETTVDVEDLAAEEDSGGMPEGEIDLDMDLSFGDEELPAPAVAGGDAEDLDAVQEALAATTPEDAEEKDLAAGTGDDDLGDLGDLEPLEEEGESADAAGGEDDELDLGDLADFDEVVEENEDQEPTQMLDEDDLPELSEAAGATEPEPAGAVEEDSDGLDLGDLADFDEVVDEDKNLETTQMLGEDDLPEPSEAAGATEPEPAGAVEEDPGGELDLDAGGELDLDLGGAVEEEPAPAAVSAVEEVEEESDLDLGELEAVEEESADPGMDLGELEEVEEEGADPGMNLDLGELEEVEEEDLDISAGALEPTTEEVEIDLDIDDEEPPEIPKQPEPDLDIDFDDSDLDMAAEEVDDALEGEVTMEMDSAEMPSDEVTMEYDSASEITDTSGEATDLGDEDEEEKEEEEEKKKSGKKKKFKRFEPKKKKGSVLGKLAFFLLVLILLAGGAFGGLAAARYLGIELPFKVPFEVPYLSLIPVKADTASLQPAAQTQALSITNDVKGYFLENGDGEPVIVIRGHVRNEYTEPRSHIRVKAVLFNSMGNKTDEAVFFAGNNITDEEIRSMGAQKTMAMLRNKQGQAGNNVGVPPNAIIPFTAVFANPPADLEDYLVEAAGSDPATAQAAPDTLAQTQALQSAPSAEQAGAADPGQTQAGMTPAPPETGLGGPAGPAPKASVP